MPIYEYRCEKCKNEFEKLIFNSSDTKIECPECKSVDVVKKMSAASLTSSSAGCSSNPGRGFS